MRGHGGAEHQEAAGSEAGTRGERAHRRQAHQLQALHRRPQTAVQYGAVVTAS